MKGIVKEFPGVRALSGISFEVYPGEVHALVGENGAGKSTLMKVLSGAYRPTAGTIEVGGVSYRSLDPETSKALGIAIVYQENDLVPSMNVTENVHVGNELVGPFGFVDFKRMRQATSGLAEELGITIDLDCRVENLSVSDQQFVKILKALSLKPRLLVMDEPTSMFNVEDAGKVLALTQRISARGIGIVYISHYLKEVVSCADRITVLRDGSVVRTHDNSRHDTSEARITEDMVGRPVDSFYQKERNEIGEIRLQVRGLKVSRGSPEIDFHARAGEILGFAGMVGSGRTEIAEALVGATPKYSGIVLLDGREVDIRRPSQGIDAGFAYITEDRQRLGLMLRHSVMGNASIVCLRNRIKGFFLSPETEEPIVRPIIEELRVKTPSLRTEAGALSGGNQQKIVLAKWLLSGGEVFIFDEPTRGIDVNAKAEFYKQISALAKQGKVVILISSDMTELISLSDRVLVVRKGRISCELEGADINEGEIIKKALGVRKDEQ